MRRLLWLFLLLPFAVPSHGQLWSGILNAPGTGTCTGNGPSATACAPAAGAWAAAGIPGGIPTGTQAGSTITATGSNQTTQIQTALDACGGTSSAEKYVNLAAGTFDVSGQLTVPSYCYLNGQGANLTIIDADGTSQAGLIVLGGGLYASPSIANDTAITGGLSSGSTSLTVASAANISVGTLLMVTELNDLANGVNPTGSEGPCTNCDYPHSHTRVSGQTVLVTGVSGTAITITPGLQHTYGATLPSWAASTNYYLNVFITHGTHTYQETASPASPYNCVSGSSAPSFSTSGGSVSDGTCTWLDMGAGTTTAPLATPYSPIAVEAGVENLQIYITNAGTSTLVGPNIIMNQCQYCFVHGVEDNYTDADHVYMYYDFGGEVSESYFSNAILHTSGTYDSCLQLAGHTSEMLIENNILERLHSSVILEDGASGNVIAYNYMLPAFDTGSPEALTPGIDFHGATTEFNLLEGNVLPDIEPDSIWGSSIYTTDFRNWAMGSGPVDYPIASGRNTVTGGATVACASLAGSETCYPFQASRAIQNSYLAFGNNIVGNVVGSPDQENNIGYGPGPGVGVTPYNSGSGVTDALQWSNSRSYDSIVYGYTFGFGELSDSGSWPLDSTTAFTSSLIHGNYGNISGAIVWSGSITHTLPASFYLSSKPSWWGSGPWPAIGPDVTGGSGPGNHTNLIPAQTCYQSVMGGSTGAGSPLSFNAARCYGAVVSPPSYLSGAVTLTGAGGVM